MLTISEFARLGQVSLRMLRHYGETRLLAPATVEDGSVTLHVGFDIGASDVTGSGRVRIVDLPAIGVSAPREPRA